jgi:hypothetical protein
MIVKVNWMIIIQVLGVDKYCFTIRFGEQVWVQKQDIINQRGHKKQKWTMALDSPPWRLHKSSGDALLYLPSAICMEEVHH